MDKTQYFYRTVVFSENGSEVALANIDKPNLVTPLEPWFAQVIPLADGQHTLDQLVRYITSRYQGSPPANLEETLSSVVERLLEGELIRTSPTPIELPYYLNQPIEQLDLEKARQLMNEDGYVVH